MLDLQTLQPLKQKCEVLEGLTSLPRGMFIASLHRITQKKISHINNHTCFLLCLDKREKRSAVTCLTRLVSATLITSVFY